MYQQYSGFAPPVSMFGSEYVRKNIKTKFDQNQYASIEFKKFLNSINDFLEENKVNIFGKTF